MSRRIARRSPSVASPTRARRQAGLAAAHAARSQGLPRSKWQIVAHHVRVRPSVSVETVAIAVSVFFAVASNGAFWHAARAASLFEGPAGSFTFLSLSVLLVGIHVLALSAMLYRRTAKVVVALLLLLAAILSYVANGNGVPLNPAAMRSVLHSNSFEVASFGTGEFARVLAWHVVLPMAVLWRIELARFSPAHTAVRRVIVVMTVFAAIALAVGLPNEDMHRLKRDPLALRYLITPANVLALGGGGPGTEEITPSHPPEPSHPK
jgi:lipid A ethanolaminephosphotransferase